MSMLNIPDFEKVELAPPQLDPGDYILNIVEDPKAITDPKSSNEYLEMQYQVVEGPNQQKPDPATGSVSPVGRKTRDRIYLTSNAYWRLKQAMICAGLLARDDTTSPIARGQFDPAMFMGCRMKVNISPNMKDGKEYRNINYVV